jgi:dihydroxyacid dehydratase/phosphogluconate dehydratase
VLIHYAQTIESIQLPDDATKIAGRLSGDALRHRPFRRRLSQTAGRNRNPCNMHLLSLAEKVKEGVKAAGLVGFRFNTIGVSSGISTGTDGMSFSLQSRELIADSIETVMTAQWYDANISIPGCDKNMPGCVMAMGRLNRPALMITAAPFERDRTTVKSWMSCLPFRATASFCPGTLANSSAARLCDTLAREPERSAGCTPPTRWLRPLRP